MRNAQRKARHVTLSAPVMVLGNSVEDVATSDKQAAIEVIECLAPSQRNAIEASLSGKALTGGQRIAKMRGLNKIRTALNLKHVKDARGCNGSKIKAKVKHVG